MRQRQLLGQEVEKLGHEPKLIAPVRPAIREAPKNDATDAEAIVIAARQPEMRFVLPKTAEQQAKSVLFRNRERLVRQRTELVSALRSALYEYGHVFPIGLAHLKRMDALVQGADCDLPSLIVTECRELLAQIAETTEKITTKTKRLNALADETDTARRLQTMPGVGPLTALAVEALPLRWNVQMRPRLRSLAWSCAPTALLGGKERGRVSKAGQTDIRRF
jgi:transposase